MQVRLFTLAIAGSLILACGLLAGYGAHRITAAVFPPPAVAAPVYVDPARQPIACPSQGARTAVILVAGQSHAANFVGERFAAVPGVYRVYDGKCYEASDPGVGAEGMFGNLYTLVADRLIQSGKFDTVLVSNAAIGSVPVASWGTGGGLANLLRAALQLPDGLQFTHAVVAEGTTDRMQKTDPKQFSDGYRQILQQIRQAAPLARIFVSLETGYCSFDGKSVYDPADPIDVALRAIPSAKGGIYPGVDMDALVPATDRYDGCHATGNAARRLADAWVKVLTAGP